MKAKKFLVILSLLAVALFVVACNGGDDTTEAPGTDPVVTTTTKAATTTEATTTEKTTTATTTAKVTTVTTTAKVTTVTTTTAAPQPEEPVVNAPVLWDGSVASAYAGGTGTASDPYQIANAAQLVYMAGNFEKGACYILTDDIMLNDLYNFSVWGTDYGLPLNVWTPIEDFDAKLDGNGKTIYGLYTEEGAFFASTIGATIENLGIAYANVYDYWEYPLGVLIGTATDTNLKNITLDYASIIIDEQLATEDTPVAGEVIMTIGGMPEVWSFENIALGALADEFIAENENYGTKFDLSIVDGKGFFEEETEGKKALAWNSNSAEAQTVILNFLNDKYTYAFWNGVEEVLVYVDGSEIAGEYKFGFALVDSEGHTWTITAGETVYVQDGSAWAEIVADGANLTLAEGYKGYVRVPVAALADSEGCAIDNTAFFVEQITFTYENAASADAEGLFYIDSIRIKVSDEASNLPSKLPTLDPVYGLTMLQDFEGEVAIRGKNENVTVAIKDGKYYVEATTSIQDTYFGVNQAVPAGTQGFLVFVDATDVIEVVDAATTISAHKAQKIGFRIQIGGQYWSVGGQYYTVGEKNNNKITMNDAWALASDGNWVRIANTNNNRLSLPEDDFCGWIFLPLDSISQVTYPSNNTNQVFLKDYLASNPGATISQVEVYYGDISKGSSLTIDDFYAVTGETKELSLNGAPATLPTNGQGYTVNQTIDFEAADLFFNPSTLTATAHGFATAGKGYEGTGAIKITAGDNGYGYTATPLRAGYGETLSIDFNDTGIMMWVDTTELQAKEGNDFVSLKLRILTAPWGGLRSDSADVPAQGGSYWTFTLKKYAGNATGYIVDENGEWDEVYNTTNYEYLDLPEGYKGYLFVPFDMFARSTSSVKMQEETGNLYNNGNGIASGYIFIRSVVTEVGNVANAGASMYIDQISIIESDWLVSEQIIPTVAPTVLPDGTSYELIHRYGFEDYSDVNWISANTNNFYFSNERAAYGNAINFTSRDTSRGEATVMVDASYLTGIKGVLFYVDFSEVEGATDYTSKGFGMGHCATVTINGNHYRSNADGAKAYYLANGSTEWVQTGAVNGDRMYVPQGFAGWVYIPVESYKINQSGLTTTVDKQIITSMNLYTDGYTYDTSKYITFDEVMFIK